MQCEIKLNYGETIKAEMIFISEFIKIRSPGDLKFKCNTLCESTMLTQHFSSIFDVVPHQRLSTETLIWAGFSAIEVLQGV